MIERRLDGITIEPNCPLDQEPRSSRSAPVLVPLVGPSAKTSNGSQMIYAKSRTVPPGAVWRYADLPLPTNLRESASRRIIVPSTNLIQFAIGCAVPPDPGALVLITSQFRSRVLTAFARHRTGIRKVTWSTVPAWVRVDAGLLSGKDSKGVPLEGPHHHARFLGWIKTASSPGYWCGVHEIFYSRSTSDSPYCEPQNARSRGQQLAQKLLRTGKCGLSRSIELYNRPQDSMRHGHEFGNLSHPMSHPGIT